jgi:hypothetical protein
VNNVRNHTGWHIQLFHGPTNGPKLKQLFAPLRDAGAITFTDIGSDYMEDWQRLSSMMLIDNFWEVTPSHIAPHRPCSLSVVMHMCPHRPSTHVVGGRRS